MIYFHNLTESMMKYHLLLQNKQRYSWNSFGDWPAIILDSQQKMNNNSLYKSNNFYLPVETMFIWLLKLIQPTMRTYITEVDTIYF